MATTMQQEGRGAGEQAAYRCAAQGPDALALAGAGADCGDEIAAVEAELGRALESGERADFKAGFAQGWDRQMKIEREAREAAATLGRRGGAAATPAQAEAGRRNGRRGGRPATSYPYRVVLSGLDRHDVVSHHTTAATAQRACDRCERQTDEAHPGARLIGYIVERRDGDTWARLDADDEG